MEKQMTAHEKFDTKLRAAIGKYGDEHIDIFVEEGEEGNVQAQGMYHSNNNSFGVTDSVPLEELGGMEALKKYEEEFEGLCICEG